MSADEQNITDAVEEGVAEPSGPIHAQEKTLYDVFCTGNNAAQLVMYCGKYGFRCETLSNAFQEKVRVEALRPMKERFRNIYRGVEVDELLSVGKSDPRLIACCVVLGHVAENTRGNAIETAVWMYEEGFKSLRIVTANYHMPRSLLEFKSLMPDVEIVAHPVFPDNVKVDNWWRFPGSSALIASEYNKYVFASLRNALLNWLPNGDRAALRSPGDPAKDAPDLDDYSASNAARKDG